MRNLYLFYAGYPVLFFTGLIFLNAVVVGKTLLECGKLRGKSCGGEFSIFQQTQLFFSIENKKLQEFIFSTEKEILLLKKRASVEVHSVKPRAKKP